LLPINRTGQRLLGGQVPDVQGRYDLTIDAQDFFTALGVDRQERHRVVAVRFAEQERTTPGFTGFRTLEDMVHGTDHAMTGTEIGAQGVQSASGGLTRSKVGIDVGTAEGVNRLLGVADQKQAVSGLLSSMQ
jgi:hypothetical protein